MKVEVRLLQCLANPARAWVPGDIFECQNQADADDLVRAGLAEALAHHAEPAKHQVSDTVTKRKPGKAH
jgi:hypothetical protein